jgi:hypothetical protein
MSVIQVTRGDQATYDLTLVDADTGDPIDLTTMTLTFTAKRQLLDLDDEAFISKTNGAGIEIDADPTTGMAVLTLLAEDTEDTVDAERLIWDVQIDNGAGDVRTPLRGTLVMVADITRFSSGVGS